MNKPKFEVLGKTAGKHDVRLANGPRVQLTDEEFEVFKKTGELPTSNEPVRQAHPEARLAALEAAMLTMKAAFADLNEKLDALTLQVKRESDGDEPEDDGAPAVDKETLEKRLMRLTAEKLREVADGLTVPDDAQKADIVALILAREFPD